jgi:hypothetical protein
MRLLLINCQLSAYGHQLRIIYPNMNAGADPRRPSGDIGSEPPERCFREPLDDAVNRIFRPATGSGMRDPLAPQLGRPHANDAVVGHGVRRVARMVRFSSILSAQSGHRRDLGGASRCPITRDSFTP